MYLQKLRAIGRMQKPGFIRYTDRGAPAVMPRFAHDGTGPSGELQCSTRSPGLATVPPERWVGLHEEFTTEAHRFPEPEPLVWMPPPPPVAVEAPPPPSPEPRFKEQVRHWKGPPRDSFAFHHADAATKARLIREEVARLQGQEQEVDIGRYCGTWDEELRLLRREADAHGYEVRGRTMSPPRRRDGTTGAEARLAREHEKYAMNLGEKCYRGLAHKDRGAW